MGEAARLLGLRRDRVQRWLDGYTRQGVVYEPVIRERPTGSDLVTWGEFVELGYLREYRSAGVSLQHLRPVIQWLREAFGVPYPLAHARPYIADRRLVVDMQAALNLPNALAMVVHTGQTLALTAPVERFLRKVEFARPDDGPVVRLRPAGDTSPVVMDPLVRFGRPSVAGVATERLWELHDAGEPLADIAAAYELDASLVGQAIAYEEQQRSLAAA